MPDSLSTPRYRAATIRSAARAEPTRGSSGSCPSQISDDQAQGTQSWWPSLAYSPTRLWADSQSGAKGGWQVMADYQRWLLHRRITSQRQVQEVMTQFWENGCGRGC